MKTEKLPLLAVRAGAWARKRILVVNVFFDDLRRHHPNPYKVPQALGPVYLAGAFAQERCEVRVYNEHYSGPLRDEGLLAWPDMLVLTGLTVAFDRMLHLTAYVRSKNPRVIVVAGGPAIRALPRYARRFFDYVCVGDVEELQEVARDTFGAPAVAPRMLPRYDLMQAHFGAGYLESSRNCNFRCSFCSLTAERNRYQKVALETLRRQILALGRRDVLMFLDNNFYGGDRGFFLARLELLKELRARGHFRRWCALVTNDFFVKDENLTLARASGCEGLFSGLESFDAQELRRYNKRQNTVLPQVALIDKCLEAGIIFHYGLMFDVSARRLHSLRQELEWVLGHPQVVLPSYVSLTIPMLGTPYFHDCLAKGLLLPGVKIRDLDGFTVSLRPLDPVDEVVSFVRGLTDLRSYRRQVVIKALDFVRRYRRRLNGFQLKLALANAALLCAPALINAPGRRALRRPPRTFVATTEPLDPQYTPLFPVAARYAAYFQPTRLTDSRGCLAEELQEDLRSAPSAAPVQVTD